jgi:SAM-dependent methyltransferase
MRRFLQSRDELRARHHALADALSELVESFVQIQTGRALEVGCARGALTDELAKRSSLTWHGVDPVIDKPTHSVAGHELLPGLAHKLPFPDSSFDCVVFANVYEHVQPEHRLASLAEIRRVLTPQGIMVGQLPNPYFPIESHSRLPFMGWLPRRLQLVYWQLTPVSFEHDFYVVTIRDLRRRAAEAGFKTELIRNFNYPSEAIPERLRGIAELIRVPMQIIPWSWQFAFRKTSPL